jgi:cell division protein FtsL
MRAGTIATVVGAVLAAGTFMSTYIYATKTELASVNEKVASQHTELVRDITAVQGDVKSVETEVRGMRESQRELQKSQHVIDENLRRLLRQNRVAPVPRPPNR